MDRQLVSLYKAFDKVKPSINHLRVWGCKCYSFLLTKLLPQGSRKAKLTNRSRIYVFIGYVDTTSSQQQLQAPNLKTTIKAYTVKFAEDIKGGTIDLNLDVQTRNKLLERKPRGRPPKVSIIISINAVILPIVAKSEVQPLIQSKDAKIQPKIFQAENLSISGKQTVEPLLQRFVHVAIPKRGRDADTDNEDEDSYQNKISKANIALILALAAIVDLDKKEENEKIAQAIICIDLQDRPGTIPTPLIYKQAVNHPIQGNEQKKAITIEIIALILNGIQEIIFLSKDANIVTSK